MAQLQTFKLPHLPDHPVHIALFRDARNAEFLRQQLLDGNTEFEYAFVDAAVVLSTTQVFAAVFRAVNDMMKQRLKSRNVHSEIVHCFSGNNNIATSFRTFGITPATTSLLAIKVSSTLTTEQIQSHLQEHVQGTSLPFSDASIAELNDLSKIRKIYKLDQPAGKPGGARQGKKGKNADQSAGEGRREMEAVVLGMMALRGS
ncbi:CGI-121-domain-containing protein [Aulographum hederae CBS 113979]|uniref:EKC/KEOPS complex subunit CGI121 n=1 Tax=Aulographum hederae CBS 113979 TaxID=1176131 RepID=A0A6G1HBH0_9PEZI|nr:CGI-121-domain-containing protein [Aulographum hederae CBS 113979]